MTAIAFIAGLLICVCTGLIVDDIFDGITDPKVKRTLEVICVVLMLYAGVRLVV